MSNEEDVISAGATRAGVQAVTKRGTVIGLELLFTDAEDPE